MAYHNHLFYSWLCRSGLWEGLWWMVHLCYMWSPPGWIGLEDSPLRWHLRSCLVPRCSLKALCVSLDFFFLFYHKVSHPLEPSHTAWDSHSMVGSGCSVSLKKRMIPGYWRVTPPSFLLYLYWSKQIQGYYIPEGREVNSTPPGEYCKARACMGDIVATISKIYSGPWSISRETLQGSQCFPKSDHKPPLLESPGEGALSICKMLSLILIFWSESDLCVGKSAVLTRPPCNSYVHWSYGRGFLSKALEIERPGFSSDCNQLTVILAVSHSLSSGFLICKLCLLIVPASLDCFLE